MSIKTKINLFKSDQLNHVTEQLIDLDNKYVEFLNRAEKNLNSAFETRWEYGKLIVENYDHIKEECGSQKEFAEIVGKSEAVISNNKRAYESLLDAGCKTFDDVKKLLKQKQIRPTISNFEKIGTLLNAPEEDTKQKEQTPKDRKRLEELMEELGEIIRRNEAGNFPDIAADASDLLEDAENAKQYIEGFDPFTADFTSEKYLNFVRNFGFDVLTREPVEKTDPHHVGFGSTKRQNDLLTLPLTRKTHSSIHYGLIKPTREELLEGLVFTMGTFIKKVL